MQVEFEPKPTIDEASGDNLAFDAPLTEPWNYFQVLPSANVPHALSLPPVRFCVSSRVCPQTMGNLSSAQNMCSAMKDCAAVQFVPSCNVNSSEPRYAHHGARTLDVRQPRASSMTASILRPRPLCSMQSITVSAPPRRAVAHPSARESRHLPTGAALETHHALSATSSQVYATNGKTTAPQHPTALHSTPAMRSGVAYNVTTNATGGPGSYSCYVASLGCGDPNESNDTCAGKTDTYSPGWTPPVTPHEACQQWATNSSWGALEQGDTLTESCSSDFGITYCAATCCALLPPP